MSPPLLPSRCDVVVIGAGMGGLTSGALLAGAGLSVCVLEATSRPGGYLAGFRRGQFVFDTAIHWLNQCGPGGVVRKALDLIGPGAPEMAPLRRVRRYKGDSFDFLLTDQPDRLREDLTRRWPAEEAGLRSFFAAAKRLGEAFSRLCAYTRGPDTMSLWERCKLGMNMGRVTVPFWRHLGVSAEAGLRRYFRDEGLRGVFCAEEDILSCLVPIGWAYTGDYQLPPRGGSQQLPTWLARRLGELGATVACRSRVTQVLLEDGRAAGVRLVRGREQTEHEVRARWVIAACDQELLYERLLPPGTVPPRLLERVRGAELYDSSVTVSLGLSVPPEELGFGEELVFLTRDGVARADHSSGDPHTAGISILAPSLRDPSLAPPGKGTLTAYVPARLEWGERWHTGPDLERGQAYKDFKRRYADVLLDRIEAALAPGLRRHIELCEVATPVTHLRYTGNRGGTIMAQRPTRANMRAKVAHYRTPVPGLLLGGHWAEYGGGVPVAVRAGINSALLVLREQRAEAFERLSAALDAPLAVAAG